MRTIRFRDQVPYPYEDFMFDLSDMIDEAFYAPIQKDARLLGELIETAMDVTFTNIHKVAGNRAYDMEDPSAGRTIEVRVLGPSSKVTFTPSSKIARRKAQSDKSVIYDKAAKITDWVFVTTEGFPKVRVHHLRGGDVLRWLHEQMNQTGQFPQSVLERIAQKTQSSSS